MRSFILLSLPLVALATPAPVTPVHSLFRRNEIVPYIIEDKCHNEGGKPSYYDKMIHAVQKAKDMASVAVREWWDEGKHGEIAATYLGIPDDGKYKDNEWAKIAHANLRRVSLLSGAVPLLSKFVDVSCTDKWNKCGDILENGKKIAGYAENNIGITGHTYDVVFCHTFFLTDTPDGIYNTWKDQPKEDIAMDWLENDAGKALHEMMHINFITEDRPHIIDERYQGKRVYGSAMVAEWVTEYKANPKFVVNNADSYTQFVNAIFFKNKFGFLPPPTRPEPLEGRLDCGGEDDRYSDAGIAERHVGPFCEKLGDTYKADTRGELVEQYDEGKPEHVELKVVWKQPTRLQPDEVEAQCKESLLHTIHGCDTNSHWKHGGAYTWGDESYSYSFYPKRDRPTQPDKAPGKCDVWYKFWYDEFYIYGGGWAGHDHGQEKLLPNLRRCGVVSEWRFDYFNEIKDDGIEWEAYGRIPIGAQQWDCVRKAVVDSGGPSDIGCGGK